MIFDGSELTFDADQTPNIALDHCKIDASRSYRFKSEVDSSLGVSFGFGHFALITRRIKTEDFLNQNILPNIVSKN
jgi:hypothetical protein